MYSSDFKVISIRSYTCFFSPRNNCHNYFLVWLSILSTNVVLYHDELKIDSRSCSFSCWNTKNSQSVKSGECSGCSMVFVAILVLNLLTFHAMAHYDCEKSMKCFPTIEDFFKASHSTAKYYFLFACTSRISS